MSHAPKLQTKYLVRRSCQMPLTQTGKTTHSLWARWFTTHAQGGARSNVKTTTPIHILSDYCDELIVAPYPSISICK